MSSKVVVEIRKRVVEKLASYGFGGSGDAELADYIMIMVVNRRSSETMSAELSVFLADKTEEFVSWIQNLIKTITAEKFKDSEKKSSSNDDQKSKSKSSSDNTKKVPSPKSKKESPKSKQIKHSDSDSDDEIVVRTKKAPPKPAAAPPKPPTVAPPRIHHPPGRVYLQTPLPVQSARPIQQQYQPQQPQQPAPPPPRSAVGAVLKPKTPTLEKPKLSSTVVVKRPLPPPHSASPVVKSSSSSSRDRHHSSGSTGESRRHSDSKHRPRDSSSLFKRTLDEVKRSSGVSSSHRESSRKRRDSDRDSDRPKSSSSKRSRTHSEAVSKSAVVSSITRAHEPKPEELDPDDLRHRLVRRSRHTSRRESDENPGEQQTEYIYEEVDQEVAGVLEHGYGSGDEFVEELIYEEAMEEQAAAEAEAQGSGTSTAGQYGGEEISDLAVSSSIVEPEETGGTAEEGGDTILDEVKREAAEEGLGLMSKVRCKYWPACTSGSRCPYFHPANKLCVTFPHCKFGADCLFTHPPCAYDGTPTGCTRSHCPYSHPSRGTCTSAGTGGSASASAGKISHHSSAPPISQSSSSSNPNTSAVKQLAICKFHPHCSNVQCKFFHPRQEVVPRACRFGADCHNGECPFLHPGEQAPQAAAARGGGRTYGGGLGRSSWPLQSAPPHHYSRPSHPPPPPVGSSRTYHASGRTNSTSSAYYRRY